jgi:phage baseplate assembly protein gpV
MLVKAPNNTRWIPGPSITNFLTAGPGAAVSYDALAGQWTVSATGIAGVESVTGTEPITVDDLDPANPVIGLNTPSITRYSGTAYVNAGYTTIQEVIDANAAGTIFIASGNYSGDVTLTTRKVISGPPVPTYTSTVGVYGNLSISGATTQYAVLNDLRFYGGNLTISGTVGDHSFSNVTIDGTTTITNGASNIGTTYFENCNLRAVNISADFAGLLFFKGCNFGGQLITNNASALQVYLSDCTGVNTSQTNVIFRGNNANPLAQVALTVDTATFSSAITPSPVDPLTQQAAAIDNTTGALISVDNFDGGTF